MRRITTGALVLTVALALAAPAASAHDRIFRTSSSFGYFADTPEAFLGDLSSRHAACERSRVVKVYRVTRRGKRLVGRDRTSSTGQWAVERSVPRARYQAVVSRRTLTPGGHRHVCRAYRSSKLMLGG